MTKSRGINVVRRWTPDKLDLLRQVYPYQGGYAIAKHVRPIGAARLLGREVRSDEAPPFLETQPTRALRAGDETFLVRSPSRDGDG